MKQYSFLLESNIQNSIDGLKKFYNTLDYGTVLDGKIYTGKKLTAKIIDKAHILSPEEIRRYNVGTCYDTTGYSYKMLSDWGVKFKSYLFTTRQKYNEEKGIWDDPTHTFLIYLDINNDHKWHWLEGSWSGYKNNDYVEQDPNKLVSIIKSLLNKSNGKGYIREIKKYPRFGISYHEFYKELMS